MIGLCALIEKSGEINKGWSSSYKQYSAHVAGADPNAVICCGLSAHGRNTEVNVVIEF